LIRWPLSRARRSWSSVFVVIRWKRASTAVKACEQTTQVGVSRGLRAPQAGQGWLKSAPHAPHVRASCSLFVSH
jgi:hypothetical protein